eukprot:Amastigsp_a509173_683.p2 type:complete len:200 gc:universal Amastigsp_a509173_683:718-119(-)
MELLAVDLSVAVNVELREESIELLGRKRRKFSLEANVVRGLSDFVLGEDAILVDVKAAERALGGELEGLWIRKHRLCLVDLLLVETALLLWLLAARRLLVHARRVLSALVVTHALLALCSSLLAELLLTPQEVPHAEPNRHHGGDGEHNSNDASGEVRRRAASRHLRVHRAGRRRGDALIGSRTRVRAFAELARRVPTA